MNAKRAGWMAACMRLCRFSVALTPVADVAAGYLGSLSASNAFALPQQGSFYLACGASTAVFMSGAALNDYLDRYKDRDLAPERPIPSGEIASRTALAISAGLGLAALGLAWAAGTRTLAAVAGVLLLALAYNLFTRRIEVLGVLNLGCIRALDLGVGITLLPPKEGSALTADGPSGAFLSAPWALMLIYGLYTAALSTTALAERGQRRMNHFIPAMAAALIALAPALAAQEQDLLLPALLLWFVLLLPLIPSPSPQPGRVEAMVGHLICGYFLLSALIVLAAGHLLACACLWIGYFLCRSLQRWFPAA